ncbi:hypothetical protein [Actinocrispum wychmicini]|uniref:Uncharacterized protein n=1 Tax=Actinocrispum wychmicini TaxID=1213861 RepID=A0A4R2K3Q7_9PSEU|nr:hypothetical protein [Actinocrispum wychmicini]TCO60945.1 hypothetical protein EV192_103527 [Actinocrispum wychmicini]
MQLELSVLLKRYRLGQAAFVDLVPPLTDDLVNAQRAGNPYATTIVRDYTDRLYAATEDALNAQRSPRHSLLAPEGRITAEQDMDQPAVPLLSEYGLGLPFNQYTLVDDIHPHIHVPAAVRALSELQSAGEAGAELTETLDRAWFLLAFSLNISLGRGQMLDPDRDLTVDLIGGCARLHHLTDAGEPPEFVRDAIDRGLAVRCFVSEWVTTDRYATTDGKIISEGHSTTWDSGLRLPVGALLGEQFGGSPAVPTDPAAALTLGRRKAESGDFTAARTAVESTLPNREAEDLLRELVAEQSCRELIAILVQHSTEKGSPARQRVVEIGKELHDMGGMGLMQAVHAECTARRRPLSRSLDLLWDGIGPWKG